jgi:phosphonate transport system substrate-binding protein
MVGRILGLILGSLAIVTIAGCYQRTERLPVADEEARRRWSSGDALDLAIVPHRLPRDEIVAHDPLARHLSAGGGRDVLLRPAATWDLVLERLRDEEADLAVLGAAAFVRARERLGVIGLARVGEAGEPTYRGAIVVRLDDPARSLADLSGRRFGLVEPESTTGHLLPLAALRGAGVLPEQLAEVRYYDRQERVAQAVRRGEADAGALRETAARQGTLRGLRILWLSEPVPGPVLVARRGLPKPDLAALRRRSAATPDGPDLALSPLGADDHAEIVRLLVELHGDRALEGDLRLAGAVAR